MLVAHGDAHRRGIIVLPGLHPYIRRKTRPADLELAQVGRAAPIVGRDDQVAAEVAAGDAVHFAAGPFQVVDRILAEVHFGDQDMGLLPAHLKKGRRAGRFSGSFVFHFGSIIAADQSERLCKFLQLDRNRPDRILSHQIHLLILSTSEKHLSG